MKIVGREAKSIFSFWNFILKIFIFKVFSVCGWLNSHMPTCHFGGLAVCLSAQREDPMESWRQKKQNRGMGGWEEWLKWRCWGWGGILSTVECLVLCGRNLLPWDRKKCKDGYWYKCRWTGAEKWHLVWRSQFSLKKMQSWLLSKREIKFRVQGGGDHLKSPLRRMRESTDKDV